MFDELSCN